MDFRLDDEQLALQDSVRRWVTSSYGFERRQSIARSAEGLSRDHWSHIAAMGWLAAALPEDAGGLGGSPIDSCIIAEELGRGLVLEPVGPVSILCAQTISLAATPAQRGALLPKIALGETIASLAHNESAARGEISFVQTRAQRTARGWRISGSKSMVTVAYNADLIIVSARTSGEDDAPEGISLFVMDPRIAGLIQHNYRNIDDTRASNMTLDAVEVGEEALLGEVGSAFTALDDAVGFATIAICAEAIGAMQQALWITRDYLKTRRQFGAAIGSFQALQHRAADMYLQIEVARAALWRALCEVESSDTATRRNAISAAKMLIGNAGRFVTGQAIQLHGGIGLTQEHIIGHYFKRMTVIEMLYGNSDHHAGKLAAALRCRSIR